MNDMLVDKELEMLGRNPEKAFGRADADFAARVRETVCGFEAEAASDSRAAAKAEAAGDSRSLAREAKATSSASTSAPALLPLRRARRISVRAFAVAAVLVVLLVGTAFAATGGFGLLSNLRYYEGQGEMLAGAEDLVNTGEGLTADFEAATFSASEYIFDGKAFYLELVVTPKDGVLLTSADTYNPLTFGGMAAPEGEDPAGPAGSAATSGKTPWYAGFDLRNSDELGDLGFRTVASGDGSLSFIVSCSTELKEGDTLDIMCHLTPYESIDGVWTNELAVDKRQVAQIQLTLPAAVALPAVSATAPVDFEALGLRMDSCTVSSSPISGYCEAEFTVIDPEKFIGFDFIYPRVKDVNGNEFLAGSLAGGSFGLVAGTTDRYRLVSDLQPFEQLPTAITLEFIDLNHDKQVVQSELINLN